jgi:enoyl-CoA hydratase/carnithine racemase
MADDARIYDLHYGISSVPGDGIHNAFEELLGVKRAAYALLTGEAIDAPAALPQNSSLNRYADAEELRGRR